MTCYENVSGKYPNDRIRVESEVVKMMIKEGTRPEFPEKLHDRASHQGTDHIMLRSTSRTADEF